MSDYFKRTPNLDGQFGEYGGSFIPPDLQKEMDKITDAYYAISKSHQFISELRSIRKHFQGRPTPIYYARTLSEEYGGRIYLKREDLNHTGAHKLNHCMGEALLAKYLGKRSSLPRQVPGSMGSLSLPLRLILALNVKFIWEKWILSKSILT